MARFGNTRNPHIHIKNKHVSIYRHLAVERQESSSREKQRMDDSSQTSVLTLFDNVRKLDRNTREHKKLTKLITMCLAKDMLPSSMVDKVGFGAMIFRFNQKHDLPTRSYFR